MQCALVQLKINFHSHFQLHKLTSSLRGSVNFVKIQMNVNPQLHSAPRDDPLKSLKTQVIILTLETFKLLGSRKLNIYFVVSLFDFCSFRWVKLNLKLCSDLIGNFKRSSHTKDFCCRLVSFPCKSYSWKWRQNLDFAVVVSLSFSGPQCFALW